MSRDELMFELERQGKMVVEVKEFLIELRGEKLLRGIYQRDPARFLETAAEYLQTNLAEMHAKLRMS